MSFTNDIVNELYDVSTSKTCCRKAFLCGLLYTAKKQDDTKQYKSFFYRNADAHKAAELIDAHFSAGAPTEVTSTSRGGHKGYSLEFVSRSLSAVLIDIDSGKKAISQAVGFRCEECESSFLRGVFMSSATVARPQSGYNVEFSAVNEARADALSTLLEGAVAKPSRVKRGERIGLYYKSNAKIADLLYVLGASTISFDVTNLSIEREIRNVENRAANCDTSNIKRTVEAARRHLDAIAYLENHGGLLALGEELEYTARLRADNVEASLSELALLHNPPISKSGLNARLSKILAAADEQREREALPIDKA